MRPAYWPIFFACSMTLVTTYIAHICTEYLSKFPDSVSFKEQNEKREPAFESHVVILFQFGNVLLYII